MSLLVTTFGSKEEFERGRAVLERRSLAYEVLSPDPGFRLVAVPALIVEEAARRELSRGGANAFLCAGWVDYTPPQVPVPAGEPPVFPDGLFGRAAISVLAPCVADVNRIRIIAQGEGDIAPVMPSLNAVMDRASYNPRAAVLTFMDAYRMVALHSHRITVAKADEIVDAWRALEEIRTRVEAVWAGRNEIEPSYETRERPPALEIFKRLPRTNCKACGEPSCLAFAVRVWSGEVSVTDCHPVFDDAGENVHLREALEEVCAALGV